MPTIENILPPNSDTLLEILSFGSLLYQARGLSQTFQLIPHGIHTERTINGKLIDTSSTQFRKYITKIVASDVNAPPLDNVWAGMTITIHCAANFCYPTGNPGSPARPAVSGSQYVEGAMTFYRPIFTCLVKSVEQHFDEWKAQCGWSLEAEEV